MRARTRRTAVVRGEDTNSPQKDSTCAGLMTRVDLHLLHKSHGNNFEDDFQADFAADRGNGEGGTRVTVATMATWARSI